VNLTSESVVFARGQAPRRSVAAPVVIGQDGGGVSATSFAVPGEVDHSEAAVQARLVTYLAG
jgi:hypothetical protein